MTNFDDKNNNSDVNKHQNQTLNHRTVVVDAKNGKVQHKTTEQQHSTDSIHDAVDPQFRPELRWPDLCAQIFLHAGAIYGLVFQFYTIKFYTLIWCKCLRVNHFKFVCFFWTYGLIMIFVWVFVLFTVFALIVSSGFGITAGAHRLFSHKSYKANAKLRLLLIFLFTISGQRDAYTWAHDHRVHHKYTVQNTLSCQYRMILIGPFIFIFLGNRCWSTWCSAWFLFCTCRLALSNTASRSRGQTENRRLKRSPKWPDCYVAKTIEHSIVCLDLNRNASLGLYIFLLFLWKNLLHNLFVWLDLPKLILHFVLCEMFVVWIINLTFGRVRVKNEIFLLPFHEKR